jgi:hypothetical protein
VGKGHGGDSVAEVVGRFLPDPRRRQSGRARCARHPDCHAFDPFVSGDPRCHEPSGATSAINKDRAQAGESKTASPTSLNDISPERRGGLRSHQGEGGRTFKQLYAEAVRRNLQGRSTMTKAQLERAIGR